MQYWYSTKTQIKEIEAKELLNKKEDKEDILINKIFNILFKFTYNQKDKVKPLPYFKWS